MVLYPYSFQAAFDPNQGMTAPRDSVGQVFAVGDTSFANPLPTFDLNGMPVTLTVGEFGYLPDFQVEGHTAVVWKSGEYMFQFATTIPVKGDEGVPGKSAYQLAQESGFEGSEAEWLESLKGANVLPTDEAIAAALADGASTSTALDQAVGDKLNTEGTVARSTALILAQAEAGQVVESLAFPAIKVSREAHASIQYFQDATYGTYEVIRVRTGGAPIPGLVEKRYCNDYEKQGTTGNNFKPAPAESLAEMYSRTGADIIINADGTVTDTQSPIYETMDSVQIKDGVIYHEFMPASNAPRGTDALGFRADGSSKVYSSRLGDTAASMVADGVVNSFCFGPALVITGTREPVTGSQLSARQILGTTATGDLIIASVDGVSNSYGINYPQAADLAVSLGMYNAVALDAGGSVQTMAGGELTHPSSDVAERKLAGFLLVHTRVVGVTGTNWKKLTLVNGWTELAATPPAVKVKGGVTYLRGAISHATASTPASKAADLPWWAKPNSYQRFPATLSSSSGLAQHYDVSTTGELLLTSSGTNTSPRYLNIVRYPKD